MKILDPSPLISVNYFDKDYDGPLNGQTYYFKAAPNNSFEFGVKEWELMRSMALKQNKLLDFINWQEGKFFRLTHLIEEVKDKDKK